MTVERRIGGLEVRADGRRLSGTVLAYGDVSPSHRERFEPGSLRMAATVPLNLFHDPERAIAWQPGGGLSLDSGPDALTMAAELPPIPAADRALAEVRAGETTGLSVEFRATRERHDGGLRVIEEATLTGIGLVRAPSYEASRVEARQRERRLWMRGEVLYGVKAHCECLDGSCNEVYFRPEALGAVASTVALTQTAADIVASIRAGSLRVRNLPDRLEWEIDETARESAAGRRLDDLAAARERVYARPLLDPDEAEFEDAEGVRSYSRARLRALLVKPILGEAEREGWQPVRFFGAPRQRRARLWL